MIHEVLKYIFPSTRYDFLKSYLLYWSNFGQITHLYNLKIVLHALCYIYKLDILIDFYDFFFNDFRGPLVIFEKLVNAYHCFLINSRPSITFVILELI